MSEQVDTQQESPLQSERGATTIKDGVVSKIVGVAANGVEGVHMGGSSGSGGLLGGVTGSNSQTRGIKVDVGRVETAIDLTMGIDYGKNILDTVEEVRRRISDQVGNMTGLRITELNVTINNIVFPDDESDDDGDRRQLPDAETGGEAGSEMRTEVRSEARTEAPTEARSMPIREPRSPARESEARPVEPRSRTHTEGSSGPVPEEEVRVENKPLEENETARLRVDDGETEVLGGRRVSESETRPSSTDSETGRAQSGQSEQSESGQSGQSGGRSGSRRRRNRGNRGNRPEGS